MNNNISLNILSGYIYKELALRFLECIQTFPFSNLGQRHFGRNHSFGQLSSLGSWFWPFSAKFSLSFKYFGISKLTKIWGSKHDILSAHTAGELAPLDYDSLWLSLDPKAEKATYCGRICSLSWTCTYSSFCWKTSTICVLERCPL